MKKNFMPIMIAAILPLAFPVMVMADHDGDLHEGTRASVGIHKDSLETRIQTEAKADISVIPVPGGAKLNGTQLRLELGASPDGTHFGVDAIRVQALRWGHLRFLGIERDRALGSPFSIEGMGLRIPVLLQGDLGNKNWTILHAGASLGYRSLSTDLGGTSSAKGGTAELICRIDNQIELTDRLQLRLMGQILYTAFVGSAEDQKSVAYRQQLEAAAGAGLWYDVGKDSPYREVARTNPATGKKTYRNIADEGKRPRLMLLDLEGSLKPLDSMTHIGAGVTAKTGFAIDF